MTLENPVFSVDRFVIKLLLLILLNLLNMKSKTVSVFALSLLANKCFLHLNFVIFCLRSWKMLMSGKVCLTS